MKQLVWACMLAIFFTIACGGNKSEYDPTKGHVLVTFTCKQLDQVVPCLPQSGFAAVLITKTQEQLRADAVGRADGVYEARFKNIEPGQYVLGFLQELKYADPNFGFGLPPSHVPVERGKEVVVGLYYDRVPQTPDEARAIARKIAQSEWEIEDSVPQGVAEIQMNIVNDEQYHLHLTIKRPHLRFDRFSELTVYEKGAVIKLIFDQSGFNEATLSAPELSNEPEYYLRPEVIRGTKGKAERPSSQQGNPVVFI